jgi:prevent-host-death family protein
MIRVGESDFLRAFDAMSEMARNDPVTITKQGRDRLVVMSAEEYARLTRGDAGACNAEAHAGRPGMAAAGTAQPAH